MGSNQERGAQHKKAIAAATTRTHRTHTTHAAAAAPSPPLAVPCLSSPPSSSVVRVSPVVADVLSPSSLKLHLRSCVLSGDVDCASSLSRQLEAQGGNFNLSWIATWIECHVHSGDWQGAERVWESMTDRKLKPNTACYRALILVYTSAGGEQLAKIDPLLVQMEHSATQFSARDYSGLIQCAHSYKRPSEVRRWSDAATAAGFFDQLDVLSRSILKYPVNRPTPVSGVAPLVPSSTGSSASAAPSPLDAGLDSIAVGGVSEALPRRWFKLSDDQKRRDRDDIPALLSKLASKGDFTAAEALIADCDRLKIPLNLSALTAWIGCYERKRQWEAAERAWKRFGELGVKPTSYSYSRLIRVYTRTGVALSRIDVALADMQRAGLSFTSQEYKRLIRTAQNAHRSELVLQWTSMAEAAGLMPPDGPSEYTMHVHRDKIAEETFAAVAALNAPALAPAPQPASATANSGTRSELAECPHGSEQTRPLKPAPTSSYLAQLQVYLGAGRVLHRCSKIDDLLAAMKDAGVSFSAAEYQTLITTANQHRHKHEAHRFTEMARTAGMIEQRMAAAAALVRSNALDLWRAMDDSQKRLSLPSLLAMTGADSGAVKSILAECKQRGIDLDVLAMNAWISCFQPQGDWAAAEGVWRRMRDNRLQPDSASYCCLMCVYLHAGGEQLSKLRGLLAVMKSRNLVFSFVEYNQLILTAAKCGLPLEVRRFARHAAANRRDEELWSDITTNLTSVIQRLASREGHQKPHSRPDQARS